MADLRRRERLASSIEQIVSQVVAQELRDPRIAEIVSITRVEVAADVSVAKIHISAMGDEATRTATMRALERSSGYVRRRLASELRIRQVPEVFWAIDRSIERGDRVIALLNSLVIPEADPNDTASRRADRDEDGTPRGYTPDDASPRGHSSGVEVIELDDDASGDVEVDDGSFEGGETPRTPFAVDPGPPTQVETSRRRPRIVPLGLPMRKRPRVR
jgi:ribosome-binding factor A